MIVMREELERKNRQGVDSVMWGGGVGGTCAYLSLLAAGGAALL